jgi:putative endonuclease
VSDDTRRQLGSAGERLAADHLQRLGLAILERNYRTRWGELDIVAYDGRALVFCEVKTRQPGADFGGPLDAVGPFKRAQVRKMAFSWLHDRRSRRPYGATLRFDAIGLTLDASGRLLSLEHVEDAF